MLETFRAGYKIKKKATYHPKCEGLGYRKIRERSKKLGILYYIKRNGTFTKVL
jgi:hypothetical protein